MARAQRQEKQKYDPSCFSTRGTGMPTSQGAQACQQPHRTSNSYLLSATETKEERRLHWPVAQPKLARDVTARPGMSASSLTFSHHIRTIAKRTHKVGVVSCEIICCPQQDPAQNSSTTNTNHISTSFRAIKPTIRADTNPIFSYMFRRLNCLLQEVTPIFKTWQNMVQMHFYPCTIRHSTYLTHGTCQINLYRVIITHKNREEWNGRACSAYGGEGRRIQGFGGETHGQETNWEKEA